MPPSVASGQTAIPRSPQSASAVGVGARLPANGRYIRHISIGCKTVFAGKRAPTRDGADSRRTPPGRPRRMPPSVALGPRRNATPRSTQPASAEGVGARLPANGRYIRHISAGCRTVFAGKRAPTRDGADSCHVFGRLRRMPPSVASGQNAIPRSPQSASAEGVGARLPANGRYI